MCNRLNGADQLLLYTFHCQLLLYTFTARGKTTAITIQKKQGLITLNTFTTGASP
jgi:hypothetical protein